MVDKVKNIDFKDGWMIITVDFWGTTVYIKFVLPNGIKRLIAAEVG